MEEIFNFLIELKREQKFYKAGHTFCEHKVTSAEIK